uniref:VWFD domain-containing protein n=1 Tax=Cyprinodon variegatus TaxID=28743 RepID=A0A3Q2C784_CYPVA
GRWRCSENSCPSRCLIEGQFVTTYDGKQYAVPGKCTYMASQLALVFWQSSMYVEVYTTVGVALEVQVFPDLLCGNRNNDTTDDFTTSSGIIESSAKLFALSWSLGYCQVDIPDPCINTDNIFADEKCSLLYDPNGIFSKCHDHIPTDQYHAACIQRTCNCGNNLQQCLCASLGSYAKACVFLGVELGDWRRATNCLTCPKNQEFSYNVRACNHTCRSLSGYDPRCERDSPPTEGCGCPEGTHLDQDGTCTPKVKCDCYHNRGVTPPGPVVLDGRQDCRNGKVCVHCSEFVQNTAKKTCSSLSKPLGANVSCESGCYCPLDQYEDHYGRCVPKNNCTCLYSGRVFSAGEFVKTNCKTTCNQGQWSCKDEEACSGKCQVYGNGHYQTFDSKWYRFDGHCQYTLVEDGSFSVRVESVPCCDEALTCSLCRDFFSHTLDCLNFQTPNYIALCDENLYTFEGDSDIACAFFKEIALLCGKRSHIWDKWRTIANCPQTCPGDLVYIEEGSPFVPSCSNQDPRFTTLETTSSCVCPAAVLNDHTDGYQCVGVHNCPCVFNDQIYSPGGIRTTRCQT